MNDQNGLVIFRFGNRNALILSPFRAKHKKASGVPSVKLLLVRLASVPALFFPHTRLHNGARS